MEHKKERRNVVFRRIGGRIVPISIAGAGGLVAADAARTTRVYSKAGVTIDKKKFAIQPFVFDRLGTRLEARVNGKLAGTSSFFRGAGEETLKDTLKSKTYGISWLGVKKNFRGQGISKVLSKQTAKEIRRAGGNELWNQVVHKRSLLTNFSSKRDKLYKITDTVYKKVGLKKALGNIKYWRNKKGQLGSDIFRSTTLVGVRKPALKPYRTLGNKLSIGFGLAALLGGTALAFGGKDE